MGTGLTRDSSLIALIIVLSAIYANYGRRDTRDFVIIARPSPDIEPLTREA